jgi:hypothetical protein
MPRRSVGIGAALGLALLTAGSAGAGDPQASWSVEVTYVVEVPVGYCVKTGGCSNGAVGYTCSGVKYCCPVSVAGDPPWAQLSQVIVQRNCSELQEEEFPNLGILIVSGPSPDPPPFTVFGTAPRR